MLTHNNTSLKGLRACRDALNILIQGTAELAASVSLFNRAATDGGIPVDTGALDECRSMLTVMNRLMYRQLSELKHLQMMGIAMRKSVESSGTGFGMQSEMEVCHERD